MAPLRLVVLVLLVVPAFGGRYDQSILTKVLIFALFAMSLDLTMGYAGLVSFGHAAFLGVAGYVGRLFTRRTRGSPRSGWCADSSGDHRRCGC